MFQFIYKVLLQFFLQIYFKRPRVAILPCFEQKSMAGTSECLGGIQKSFGKFIIIFFTSSLNKEKYVTKSSDNNVILYLLQLKKN